MNYSSLGIIPARIGSSQVKRKNIRKLLGKPLIAYAIEAALESKLNRVIVSTDSLEIAEIAKYYGADVPFLRPPKFSHNKAKAIDVVQHCLSWLIENESWRPDMIAYLQPTSPMRDFYHINKAIESMDENVSSVISLVEVDQHPYYMFTKNKDNKINEFIKINNKPERRQDLPIIYCSNPLLAISWTSYIEKIVSKNGLIVNLKNFNPIYINNIDSIDINNEKDFLVATELMKQKISNSQHEKKYRAIA